MSNAFIHRILTIDDNPAIHEDFRKLFAVDLVQAESFDAIESDVFGGDEKPVFAQTFELDAASQGQEGLEKVRVASEAGRPYSLAFVDVRMPPGWDGVETIQHLWEVDPELQVVICTAYSDYSWEEMRQRLGNSDSLLVLKKPFDTVEVLQIAHALTRKWELARNARASMEQLDRKVAERTDALEREMAERVRVEENLRQAQKMEAVGQLAAGIAHDFNNLLTVIQGHVGLLLSTSNNGVNRTECLRQVSFAADRAAALTRQLLVFSRKEVERSKPLDLNRVLTDASKLLCRIIGEHIELKLKLAEEPANLTADESNLDQVIMNLAVNARDAMPDGGALSLSTAIKILDSDCVRRHPKARPGTYVCLTVSDTGCGMDNVTLSRIFEPFFTTKEVGKGTGIGLATVYGIVQQHHGWIEVESQPGHGTTFKVFLPRRDGNSVTPGQTEFAFKLPPRATAQPTVLVVEDEPGVREFITTVLKMNSFRVHEATDGVDALKIWSHHGPEVDVLFTDMVMPNGLSGRGLADKLLKERPELKVVYASGYSAETIGAEWLNAPGVEFLQKPYNADALLRAVSTCLSPNRSGLAA